MSGFFQNLLTDAAAGFFGNEYLRDYTHASKTFRPNAYQYAPKLKFLFHVYFEINQSAYAVGIPQGANFGLAVKSIKLSIRYDNAVQSPLTSGVGTSVGRALGGTSTTGIGSGQG